MSSFAVTLGNPAEWKSLAVQQRAPEMYQLDLVPN